MQEKRKHLWALGGVVAVFIWSGIHPHDYLTWIMEVFPVIVGVTVILWIYPKFQFTTFACLLLAIHAAILMIGGHYTYAEMPLFNWLRDAFHLSRNHYDRLGHLAQGFFPAIVAREVMIRCSPLKPGKWLFWVVVFFCMALSASYEFIEWWSALILGNSADAFLATQGDVWDTQWDMFLCLCGALLSQILLGRYHDGKLKRIGAL